MRGEDMVNFKARVFDAINEDIVTHCTNAVTGINLKPNECTYVLVEYTGNTSSLRTNK